MPDTKISALPSLTGLEADNTDLLAIVDTSASTTKKISRGEFFSSVDSISFDMTNVLAAPTEGQLTWDTGEKTLVLGLNGGNVKLNLGQNLQYRVHNNSGSTIPAGTVVKQSGVLGGSGTITVAPALANGSTKSDFFLGLTAEDIPNGSAGIVTTFGKVRGINTSAFSVGDVLYASPTVAGGLTTVRPDAPNNIVYVASVLSSSNNGTLFVNKHTEDIWQGVPATSSSTGSKGDNAFDSNYFYVCVATNTWKRVALTSW